MSDEDGFRGTGKVTGRNVDLPEGVLLQVRWKDEPGGSMVTRCVLGEEGFPAEYKTGLMLAMIGKTILEGLRDHSGGTQAMMEQAMAGMAEGFKNEMELS